MTGKEKMDLRLLSSGGSIRGSLIQSTQALTSRVFTEDPGYRPDVTLWATGDVVTARLYAHRPRSAGTPQYELQTPLSEPFTVGDLFKLGDEGCWMCSESFNAHEQYNAGMLDYCNAEVPVQVGDNIVYYPVYTRNATQYNSGETPRNMMTIGSSQHLCYITCDESTVLINNGFRFIMDKNREQPTVYQLTQVDTSSYAYGPVGIIQWTVVEDQFIVGKDDPVTGVCPTAQKLAEQGETDGGDTPPDDNDDDGWL